nr:MAG TPA: hypothetical protein [Caudoviricetes sp.]
MIAVERQSVIGCLLLTIKKQIEDKRCVPEWGKSMDENSHVPCCFIYHKVLYAP